MIKDKWFVLTSYAYRFGEPESPTTIAHSKSKKTLIKYMNIIKEEVRADTGRTITSEDECSFSCKDDKDKWFYEWSISEETIKFIDDSDLETPESIEKISEWDI